MEVRKDTRLVRIGYSKFAAVYLCMGPVRLLMSTTSTEKFKIQKLNLKAYRHSHTHSMTPTSLETDGDLAWMHVD